MPLNCCMRHIAVFSVVLIIVPCVASGQLVTVGVKGGMELAPTTNDTNQSKRYVVGPSVEVRLPARFAIEADALYQRVGSGSSFLFRTPEGTVSYSNRERGNSWEFPVLGKYYFRSRVSNWQPFVATGYALRTIDIHANTVTMFPADSSERNQTFDNRHGTGLGVGAVGAAGVRLNAGRIALAPEIRYTRWSDNANNSRRSNSAKFLLGITF